MNPENDFVMVDYDDAVATTLPFETPDVIDRLRVWLAHTEYMSAGNEYMKHLHSYVPGTGDWLRQSESVRQWHNSDAVGCLWINGMPGSGKSVWAAVEARRLAEEKGVPTLFFFFRQIVATNHDPHFLVRDWMAQLLSYSPTLQNSLKNYIEKGRAVGDVPLKELWDKLCDALKLIQAVYCIADALDEMDDGHDEFLVALLNLGKLRPKSIKVLLTSRPITRIAAIMRDSSVMSISLERKKTDPDIVQYVNVRLAGLSDKLSQAKKEELKNAICNWAKGLFLYARLMTDNLFRCVSEGTVTEESLPQWLKSLPTNLNELYTSLLAEQSVRSGIPQDLQLAILQSVTHSVRPLRLLELAAILTLSREEVPLKEAKDFVRESCGRLLETLEDETVSVIHHSFTEFLTETNPDEGINPVHRFPVICSMSAHSALALMCIRYLSASAASSLSSDESDADQESSELATEEESKSEDYGKLLNLRQCACLFVSSPDPYPRPSTRIRQLKLQMPFLNYAADYVAHHLNRADINDVARSGVLESIFSQGKPAFMLWLRMKWTSPPSLKINPLHIAAYLGLSDYLQYLISAGTPVDVRDNEGRTAISYAAQEGHEKIVDILIDHGADPNLEDAIGLAPLHHAAGANHARIIKLLLHKGVHPLTQKKKHSRAGTFDLFHHQGETAVYYACKRGHAETVAEFIDYLDSDKLCECLNAMAKEGNIEAVSVLLRTGKVPIDGLADGKTALFNAASSTSIDIIKILLENGANPNLPRPETDSDRFQGCCINIGYEKELVVGLTPIHEFVREAVHRPYKYNEGGRDCLMHLLKAGGDPLVKTTKGMTPLHIACAKPRTTGFSQLDVTVSATIAEHLLELGADPSAAANDGQTPLHYAIWSIQLIEILVKHGADINATDYEGQSALARLLWYSYSKDFINILQKLLELGADCNSPDRNGTTPVHVAFRNHAQSTQVLTMLRQYGGDISRKNYEGDSPMFFLNDRCTEEFLRELVAIGLDLNTTTDRKGRNLLLKFVDSYNYKVDGLPLLLKMGCDIASRDITGSTVLHKVVCKAPALKAFEMLVQAGADPNWVTFAGNSPLHEIAQFKYVELDEVKEVVGALLSQGSSIVAKNRAGQTPLHLAITTYVFNEQRRGRFIDFLIDKVTSSHCDLNVQDNSGSSPVHYAAMTSEFHLARLLKAGADIWIRNFEGLTPLHVAARASQSNAVAVLLRESKRQGLLNKYVDQKDYRLRTALHYACRSGHAESVRLLLENGASHAARDRWERTPIHSLAELPQEKEYLQSFSWRGSDWVSSRYAELRGIGYDRGNDKTYDADNSISPFDIAEIVATRGPGRVVDILNMLVEFGADLEAKEISNMTPMDVAAYTSCSELLQELKNRGLRSKDGIPETVLCISNAEDARLLSQEAGQDVEKQRKIFRVLLEAHNYVLFKEFSRYADVKSTLQDSGTVLHELVDLGHIPLLETFIADVIEFERSGIAIRGRTCNTLLITACTRSLPSLHIIKFLVEKAGVDMDCAASVKSKAMSIYVPAGETPLHCLALGRNVWNIAAIEYLVDAGANIEALNNQRQTPLMVAVTADDYLYGFWNEDTARVLLKLGANANVVGRDGKSALNNSKRIGISTALLEHGADMSLGKGSIMSFAIDSMDIDALALLLAAGANPNYRCINNPPDAPDRDYFGNPTNLNLLYPLHHAAWLSYLTPEIESVGYVITQKLLDNGADPLAKYENSNTILHHLIESGGLVEPFWGFPQLDLERRGLGGRTLLLSACRTNKTLHEMREAKNMSEKLSHITTLLDRGAVVDAVDEQGLNALHWLSDTEWPLNESQQMGFIAILDRAPQLTHQRDYQGFTPLHFASTKLNKWAFETLVARGANPLETTAFGDTVLHLITQKLYGAKEQSARAVELFEKAVALGVPVNARNDVGETLIFDFMASNPSALSYEGCQDPVDYREVFGVVKNAGVDFSVRNNAGESLLHIVVKRPSHSPAHHMEWGMMRTDMTWRFQDLLALGVDPLTEDNQQRTAIDVAATLGLGYIVNMFQGSEIEVSMPDTAKGVPFGVSPWVL